MKLRQRLAQRLINYGVRLYGDIEVVDTVKEIKREKHTPQSAVVEATLEAEQWAPEQHGNVIIEEPLIMTKFRRGDEV